MQAEAEITRDMICIFPFSPEEIFGVPRFQMAVWLGVKEGGVEREGEVQEAEKGKGSIY